MDEMAFHGSLKVYVGTSNLKELTYIHSAHRLTPDSAIARTCPKHQMQTTLGKVTSGMEVLEL